MSYTEDVWIPLKVASRALENSWGSYFVARNKLYAEFSNHNVITRASTYVVRTVTDNEPKEEILHNIELGPISWKAHAEQSLANKNKIAFNSDVYLREYHYGSDGKLQSSTTIIGILVHKKSFERIFSDATSFANSPTYPKEEAANCNVLHLSEARGSSRSGGQGRPSSMHLIEYELRLRAQGDFVPEKTVSTLSDIMNDWIKKNHPTDQPPTAKTIKNRLGPLMRELGLVLPR